MLTIRTENGYQVLVNIKNLSLITEYEGNLLLSFEIPTKDSSYQYMKEEKILYFEDNAYIIKTINQRKDITTITAELDLVTWKERVYQSFYKEDLLFHQVIALISPVGWQFEQMGSITERKTLNLIGVTDYDILMACKDLYGIVYEFHVLEKKIKVIKPDLIQARGLYMSDELNLQDVEYKGSTVSLITRLYAYGKKIEEKDEDGKVTNITCVTFADINGNKDYVENKKYCDRTISAYWQDDKYTDAKELLHDALEKIKPLSEPVRSYGCKLIDLSRVNEKYRMLDFQMYDKVTLIDSSGIRVVHQIVEYKRYPNQEQLNEVTLSTEFKKITGKIDNITSSIGQLDTSLKHSETTMNNIIRDVKSNSFFIKDTYQKGETDTQISSAIQQSEKEINLSIQEVNDGVKKIHRKKMYRLEIASSNGVFFKNSNIQTVLSARVWSWDEDVTETLPDILFLWTRVSDNKANDEYWNREHGKYTKQITVTNGDVDQRATFFCDLNITLEE